MATPSFNTVVKKTGTPTAMSSESMSLVSGSTVQYQIDTASRRIWDRDTTLTFVQTTAGTTISTTAIVTIDYLFGKVTFDANQNTVTVSGNYLPATNVARASAYTMEQARELIDDTDFESTGFRSRNVGPLDVTITVSQFTEVNTSDFKTFFDWLNDDESHVIEIRPGGTTTTIARGFFRMETDNNSGDIGSLEQAELSFRVDASTEAAFNWDSP